MERMLAQPQFAIDEESTDDNIFGTLSTSTTEQTILSTIPYDEGWHVYVDGQQVEIYEALDSLLAFNIADAGEHTLELKYMPSIYKLGSALSLGAIIAFILICIADLVLKLTVFKKRKIVLVADTWVLEDLDTDEVAELPESLAQETAEENDTTNTED